MDQSNGCNRYRIHTDAVKEFLITPTLSPQEMAYTYASEADILNMALFGKTAAQWRSEKGIKGKTPNIRDFTVRIVVHNGNFIPLIVSVIIDDISYLVC